VTLPANDISVHVLGRFAVLRGGVEVVLPAGRPQRLVKFLATREGGRAGVAEVVTGLWPNVSSATGRRRLRIVLRRLHKACPHLIVRKNGTLALHKRVEVDAQLFERGAQYALGETGPRGSGRLDPIAIARVAVGRYAGDLLADDVDEPWTGKPRERLRLRYLTLVGLISTSGTEGDTRREPTAPDPAPEGEAGAGVREPRMPPRPPSRSGAEALSPPQPEQGPAEAVGELRVA